MRTNGRFSRIGTWTLALVAFFAFAGSAQAVSLVNGDFETGDLTGWTTFTTANGTLGQGFPQVVLFDTTNTGTATNSASFNVGQIVFMGGGPAAGGGILQDVILFAGSLSISVDIATVDAGGANLAGGLFDLLLDGVVVDSHDFGSISFGATEFSMLANVSGVTGGSHEIAIRMTRPFRSEGNASPTQYLDNIAISGTATQNPVPEPSAALLFGIGCVVVGWTTRRPSRR